MSTVAIHPLEAPLPERRLPAGRRELLAALVLQVGAVLIVLAATTLRVYELDRFFVPKELVLHLTALLAGLLALRSLRQLSFTTTDWLLVLYLALSALSAVFATNHWQAARALAISASSISLFWTARALAEAGLARRVLAALALAVVVAAVTSLLQTYGVRTEFFSTNRAPGGTLGNRNFVAHVAAFGLPLVLLAAIDARRFTRYLLAALGASLVMAALILTRSRAGWLAVAGVLAVILGGLVVSATLRRHRRTLGRLLGVLLLAAIAVVTAVRIPNALRWNSDNPYLESVRSVANFQEGSGRGRLVQYRQSLRMALRHPLVGVGPGNWGVEYPDYAARRDPSLGAVDRGTTANPWPSSDWIAHVSERGFAATAVLALAFLGLALGALARMRTALEPESALRATALLAALAAVAIAGTFDAVLLLALPSLILWTAAGALAAEPTASEQGPRAARGVAAAVLVVVLLAGVGAVRSGTQLGAMALHDATSNSRLLRVAAHIDPGNYRLHLQLARRGSGLSRSARCDHARAAHALYPLARVAASLNRGCN